MDLKASDADKTAFSEDFFVCRAIYTIRTLAIDAVDRLLRAL